VAAPNDPQTQLCPATQGCLALYCLFPKGVLLTLGKAVQKEPPLAAPNVSQNRLRPAGQACHCPPIIARRRAAGDVRDARLGRAEAITLSYARPRAVSVLDRCSQRSAKPCRRETLLPSLGS
jgi:hypothetical protein